MEKKQEEIEKLELMGEKLKDKTKNMEKQFDEMKNVFPKQLHV